MDSPSLFDQQKNTTRSPKKTGLTPARMAIVLAVGAAFLGILIYALVMREDIRTTEVDIPLISAPDTAVKRRPDAPGGLDFPNRDKLVFNLLDESVQGTGGDATAPTPPAPLDIIPAQPSVADVQPVITEPKIAKIIAEDVQPTPKPTAKPVDSLANIITAEAKTPTPAPVQAVKPTPAPTPTKGEYGTQLASFVTKADAERALITFLKTHKSLLGALTGEVQAKDIGQGRGTRYRARFIGLPSRSAATQLCTALKAKNQGCLVVKR